MFRGCSILLLLGCALGIGCSAASDPEATAVASPAARGEEPEPTSGEADDRASDEPAPLESPLFGDFPARVALLTPASGAGSRPLLQWESVDGAVLYGAYVYAPGGRVYWAWTGRSTSVHVGGEPQLRDGAAGPSVVKGMSWAVIAYDADLLPIAVSGLRPIAP